MRAVRIALAATVVGLGLACGAAGDAEPDAPEVDPDSNRLTPAEVNRICDRFDDACAESWCEGSTDFEFTDLQCPKGSTDCTVSFKYKKVVSKDKDWQEGTCDLTGIAKRTDLVSEDKATQNAIDQLAKCVEPIAKE